MKRSEILKKLEGELEVDRFDTNVSNKDMANALLCCIERAGMRPPVAKLHTSGQFPGDDFEFEIDCWEEDYYGED